MSREGDPRRPAGERGGEKQAQGGRILVVDDERMVRRVTVSILQRAGFTVLDAGNGGEGMALAREHAGEIDLLFTDLSMPDVSGLDVAAEFLRHNPGRPVIYTSGYSDVELVSRVEKKGGIFLEKPYEVRQLAQVVRSALAGGGSRREA